MMARIKPGVRREWLYVLAGLVWAGVGFMLVRLAFGWLVDLTGWPALSLSAAGIVTGAGAGVSRFSSIARRNVSRIAAAPDIACVFSFQAWDGYLIMTFMIGLGVLLRHSAVPKWALAPVYLAVGTALLLASINYFRAFLGSRSAR